MAKQAIKLKIAGKSYSFTIESEKEEMYRLAEKEVNAYAAKFEKVKFDGFTTQDCLAMAALQLAISNIGMAQSRSIGNGDLEKLEEIDREMAGYLDRIKL